MSALLGVENLRVQFGPVDAVRGLSYRVENGARLAIVGGPGSGKTVAALATIGLTRGASISGQIAFNGRDLLLASEDELRRVRGNEIGMALADPLGSLHPLYSIGWQVSEAILAHRRVTKAAARDRTIDLLELMGMPDPHRRLGDHPDDLAPGDLRRVTLAIALANEPKLLIADDPTGGLGPPAREQILQLLAELQTALVVFTREPGVAEALAAEVHAMPHSSSST
jgi:peptide/nickel transport system ATP-binding protein